MDNTKYRIIYYHTKEKYFLSFQNYTLSFEFCGIPISTVKTVDSQTNVYSFKRNLSEGSFTKTSFQRALV